MRKLFVFLILGVLLVSLIGSLVLAYHGNNDKGNSNNSEEEDECSVDADCDENEFCVRGECEDVDETEDEVEDEDDNETEIEDDDNDENEDENGGLGQTIHNRVKAGVYTNEEGEEIRVSELAQNRTRLQVNETEVETELEIEEETEQNKTKLKVQLSNGKNAEIKIMPDTASERVLERLRLKVCNESNNCTIELKEVGKNQEEREVAYEVQVQRHMRILALFRVKAQVKAQVSAETGEIIVVKKPWWAFLATESEE